MLAHSASQPSLSLGARQSSQSTPFVARHGIGGGRYDPAQSDPTRGMRSTTNGGARPASSASHLVRSSSAATIGSIAEEPEPYSAEAAAAWCGAPHASSSAPRPRPPAAPVASRSQPRRRSPHTPRSASPAPLPPHEGNNSRVDALLIHHAAGRSAPPTWVVRAMRALETEYERQLAEMQASFKPSYVPFLNAAHWCGGAGV